MNVVTGSQVLLMLLFTLQASLTSCIAALLLAFFTTHLGKTVT